MANRYWVGGTGNWTDTAHWSTSSGGAGGATRPGSSDNVFFDANSSGGTCTLDDTAVTLDLSFDGWTGTIAGTKPMSIFGSFTGGASASFGSWAKDVGFYSTSTGRTITINGMNLGNCSFVFEGAGGGWTLQDALDIGAGRVQITKGAVNTNGVSINCKNFWSSNGNVRTINLGSSVITLGGGIWNFLTSTNLTFDAGTSIINAAAQAFYTGGQTFNEFNLAILGFSTSIMGGGTFAIFRGVSPGKTYKFTAGTTTTITDTFDFTGTAGSLITLESTVAGSAFTLAKAGDAVCCDYLSVKDSTAGGGAEWHAGSNSTDVSGNSGWTFDDCGGGGSFVPRMALLGVG